MGVWCRYWKGVSGCHQTILCLKSPLFRSDLQEHLHFLCILCISQYRSQVQGMVFCFALFSILLTFMQTESICQTNCIFQLILPHAPDILPLNLLKVMWWGRFNRVCSQRCAEWSSFIGQYCYKKCGRLVVITLLLLFIDVSILPSPSIICM